MSIEKNKQQKISLDQGPVVTIGIGWHKKKSDGHPHDLDSSILLVSADGQCHDKQDFCFYQQGHRTVYNGAVIHFGDENTGAKEGDDERIDINFSLVPDHISKIIVVVSIHHAKAREQNFGQVDGAYVRVLDPIGKELIAYDLSEEKSFSTAVEFCEITRHGEDWIFEAVERGNVNGLAAIIQKYGFKPK